MTWYVKAMRFSKFRFVLTRHQLKALGQLPIIGGSNCQSVTKTPTHGEEFRIGERISVKALHTPCHTQDSICYFMQDGNERVVFTGDTLFIGGTCLSIFFSLHSFLLTSRNRCIECFVLELIACFRVWSVFRRQCRGDA